MAVITGPNSDSRLAGGLCAKLTTVHTMSFTDWRPRGEMLDENKARI